MKKIICILAAALLLFSCKKQAPEAPVHELTPIEQSKQNLDKIGAEIAKVMESVGDEKLSDYLLSHGKVSVVPLGTVTITLDGDDGSLLRAEFVREKGRTAVEISLPDDMYIGGYMDLGEFIHNYDRTAQTPAIDALDSCLDLTLYYHGEATAALGLEARHENEAGADSWSILPVFRFSDGTSYAVSSVVLIEEFLALFLKNEGSRT